MGSSLPATAEGNLWRTPMAHLLVYAVDRRITGELVFVDPSGVENVVLFSDGSAIKIRPADGYARLGQMLIEAGAIDEPTLRDALATKGLLGDVLLLAGRVDIQVLERVAQAQFVRRMMRLFSLPQETCYRYYEGRTTLLEGADPPARVDPLAILWAGLREYGAPQALVQSTLAALGDRAIRLHPRTTVARLGLDEAETRVIEGIQKSSMSLRALCEGKLIPDTILARLAYALLITRQLELGVASGPPVGVVEPARERPRTASSDRPQASSAGGAVLGRLQLKSSTYREGAAAPDPPGEGEHRRTCYSDRPLPSERRSHPQIEEPEAIQGSGDSGSRRL